MARICVEVNLSSALPKKIYLTVASTNGFWQRIEAEDMPSYCGCCFRQGHADDHCRIKHPNINNDARTCQGSRHNHVHISGIHPTTFVGSGHEAVGNRSHRTDSKVGTSFIAVGNKGSGDEGKECRDGQIRTTMLYQQVTSDKIKGGERKGDGFQSRKGEAGGDGDVDGEGEGVIQPVAGSKGAIVGEGKNIGEGKNGTKGDVEIQGKAGGEKIASNMENVVGLSAGGERKAVGDGILDGERKAATEGYHVGEGETRGEKMKDTLGQLAKGAMVAAGYEKIDEMAEEDGEVAANRYAVGEGEACGENSAAITRYSIGEELVLVKVGEVIPSFYQQRGKEIVMESLAPLSTSNGNDA